MKNLIKKYENKKAELEIKIESCKGSEDGNVQAVRHSLVAQKKLAQEIIEDLAVKASEKTYRVRRIRKCGATHPCSGHDSLKEAMKELTTIAITLKNTDLTYFVEEGANGITLRQIASLTVGDGIQII